MYIDLTLTVPPESPLMQWAQSQANPYVAMGHIGTHLDTYLHRPIPLEYVQSRGVLFQVPGVSEITEQHVDLSQIQPGDFVLFHTGHEQKYGYGQPDYFAQQPQLSHRLIDRLLEKQIHFIGIDFPGIRSTTGHEPADHLCEEHGVYVIENLTRLSQLSDRPFKVYTLWFDDPVKSGLLCRVIVDQ